jgi:hypothetical protein
MFRLACRQDDTRCVIVVPGTFLMSPRLKASLAVDGIDDQFVEGHELPAAVARQVPERMVGRLLPADEARELLDAMTG